MKSFLKISLIYFSIYYILTPVLYENFFSIDILLYVPNELNITEYIITILLSLLIIFIKPFRLITFNEKYVFLKQVINFFFENRSFILFFNIVFLITLFYGQSLSSFRYSSEGFSDSGFFLKIYSIVQSIIFYIYFYYLFSINSRNSIFQSWSLLRVVIILNLVFSVNGNISALSNSFLILLYLFPSFKKIILKPVRELIGFKNILLGLILSIVLFIALVFGNATKMDMSLSDSYELYESNELNMSGKYIFGYLLSTPYVSYRASQSAHSDTEFNYFQIPFDGLKYRISVLLGLDRDKPEYSSVNRYNFEKITKIEFVKADFRQGTSPGLLATFRYSNSYLIFIITLFIYLNFVKLRISRIMIEFPKFNLFGYLILLFFFFNIYFQSPLDLLNFLDNILIIILFMEMLYIKSFFKIK